MNTFYCNTSTVYIHPMDSMVYLYAFALYVEENAIRTLQNVLFSVHKQASTVPMYENAG